jgi:hypothetical protein
MPERSNQSLPLYPPVAFCGIDDGTEVRPATIPFDPSLIYTKVDQAPTLNGQPAEAASIAAINQYVVIPQLPQRVTYW